MNLNRPDRRTALAALAGSLAATAVPRIVTAQEATIRVGTIPVDTAASIFYADDGGYLKNAGLTATIMPMSSGPVIAQAVAGGALDIGVANAATVAAARTRGLPFRFLFPASVSGYTATDLIMVPKDSTVQKAADLNGKTIAINGLKDLQQISASAWLDKHGGDSKTVRFIEVPFPEMGAAMEQHRVDAACPTEPFSSAAKANGARSLGDMLDWAPHFMIVGYFASEAWLNAHADTAAKFVTAMRQASQWANTHRGESAALLVKHSRVKEDVATTMVRATYGTDLDRAVLQPVLDGALKYGVIDKPVPVADIMWTPARR